MLRKSSWLWIEIREGAFSIHPKFAPSGCQSLKMLSGFGVELNTFQYTKNQGDVFP